MKMKQTMKKLYICTLAVMMLVTMMPICTQAKTAALHTVFSQKQVNDRISEIRDYYYNKPKQLTIKKQKIRLDSGTCTISYYVHGKDLMFGYVLDGKTEYRMYFYKNQLIQMLVDAPGKTRKTYTQLYTELEHTFYDEAVLDYMMMENFARKAMDRYASPKKQILVDQPVVITGISGNWITYHKLAGYGSDGCMWSIGKTAYKAKLSSNVKIEDYSNDPMTPAYRNTKWLKKQVSEPNFGEAVCLTKRGNTVSKVTIIYFP